MIGWSSVSCVGASRASATGPRARLVEPDMAVAADPQELEVEPSVGLDPAIEQGGVLGDEWLGDGAVEDMRRAAARSTRLKRCRCMYARALGRSAGSDNTRRGYRVTIL